MDPATAIFFLIQLFQQAMGFLINTMVSLFGVGFAAGAIIGYLVTRVAKTMLGGLKGFIIIGFIILLIVVVMFLVLLFVSPETLSGLLGSGVVPTT